MNLPFNKVIFNPIRLRILEELYGEEWVLFQNLKHILELTAGNLASHMRALEKHDLVEFKKDFQGRKPRTSFMLTGKGEKELMQAKEWFYDTFLEGGNGGVRQKT